MSMTRELDIRSVPPPRRHPEIFGTFDALGTDESFVLVNDHDPKPLLYQFQAERAGRFEWSVLERGPDRFRVEIRRRSSEGPRGVSEYLEADHRRLDGERALDDEDAGAGEAPGGRHREPVGGEDDGGGVPAPAIRTPPSLRPALRTRAR